jgi:hypothetical protein
MGPSSLEDQEDRGAAFTHMDEGDLFATPSTTIRLSEVRDSHTLTHTNQPSVICVRGVI